MSELPLVKDLSLGLAPEKFYTCQIEDRHAVRRWRNSPEAHNHHIPSSNWCLPTVASMVCKAEGIYVPSQDELFRLGCKLEMYRFKADDSGWEGALHPQVPRFFRELGLRARWMDRMSVDHVAHALHRNLYVVPSVSPDIRFRWNRKPKKQSGHFVLIYGYHTDEDRRRHFHLQNSAGFADLHSQIGVKLPERRLAQVFPRGKALLVRSRLHRHSKISP